MTRPRSASLLRRRLWACLALPAALYAGAAQATDEDTQAWTVVQASRPIDDGVTLSIDVQGRFSDDASRLGQLLIRPSIGWRVAEGTTASLGYAYVRTTPPSGIDTEEHRGWQQLSYRLAGDGKGVTVTGRTRLEQRWLEGSGDTGWRVRQQLRVTAPVTGEVRAVAWTEPFIGINQTDWGQRDGVHLWRSFVGVSVPISKGVTLEPGYLHQRSFRPGQDSEIHAAAIWINLQF